MAHSTAQLWAADHAACFDRKAPAKCAAILPPAATGSPPDFVTPTTGSRVVGVHIGCSCHLVPGEWQVLQWHAGHASTAQLHADKSWACTCANLRSRLVSAKQECRVQYGLRAGGQGTNRGQLCGEHAGHGAELSLAW